MPRFLEDKLRKEYGDNSHAIFGTLNHIGAMHGNRETAKGKDMEKKHTQDMAEKKTGGSITAGGGSGVGRMEKAAKASGKYAEGGTVRGAGAAIRGKKYSSC